MANDSFPSFNNPRIQHIKVPLNISLADSQGTTMLPFLQTASEPIPLEILSVHSSDIILANYGHPYPMQPDQQPASDISENVLIVIPSLSLKKRSKKPVLESVPTCRSPDVNIWLSRLLQAINNPDNTVSNSNRVPRFPSLEPPISATQSIEVNSEQFRHQLPSPEAKIVLKRVSISIHLGLAMEFHPRICVIYARISKMALGNNTGSIHSQGYFQTQPKNLLYSLDQHRNL